MASGPVLRTVTVNRNACTGAWSAMPAALPDGTYTARAQQDDSFLNSGFSAPVTFTIDTVAPAPTITVPAAGATVGPTPVISGAAGNATGDATTLSVNVYAGATATGAPVRTLTATRTGATWSVTTTPALAGGTYTARATQTDDVGHSGLSNARTFIVDATAPAPTILQPTAGQWLTNTTPTVSGRAGTAAGDSTTVTVKLYAGAAATGAPVRTLTTTRAGNAWTLSVTPSLPDGQYTAQAIQSDAVGNVGTSAARTFNIDTTTPAVTISAPTAGQRVGARPPISGLAGILAGDSATVTVRIYSGASTAGALVQTRTATRDATTGAWTVTPATLADGQYTAQASQTDSAGHTGTSAAVSFFADATAPAGVAITAPAANQWLATGTPAIAGTAGNATGDDPALTVNVYAGAAASGVPVRILTATSRRDRLERSRRPGARRRPVHRAGPPGRCLRECHELRRPDLQRRHHDAGRLDQRSHRRPARRRAAADLRGRRHRHRRQRDRDGPDLRRGERRRRAGPDLDRDPQRDDGSLDRHAGNARRRPVHRAGHADRQRGAHRHVARGHLRHRRDGSGGRRDHRSHREPVAQHGDPRDQRNGRQCSR